MTDYTVQLENDWKDFVDEVMALIEVGVDFNDIVNITGGTPEDVREVFEQENI